MLQHAADLCFSDTVTKHESFQDWNDIPCTLVFPVSAEEHSTKQALERMLNMNAAISVPPSY